MVKKFGICKGEDCNSKGKTIYIANSHYQLCNFCNQKRLGPSIAKSNEIEQKEELYKIYNWMNLNCEQICCGCGRNGMLSHSHLVPRSRNKELEIDFANIVYHCLERVDGSEGCHSRWESIQKEKLLTLNNLENHLNYLKYNDEIYYEIYMQVLNG